MDIRDPMSHEQRPEDLFERLPEDPQARDLLVERFRPLAESLARRYAAHGEHLEDLIQVASVGLIKAIDRFEPARGVPFPAFAVPTILGELKRHFRDAGWPVRVPRRVQENALRLKELMAHFGQEAGRSPTVAELAEQTGLSEEECLEAIEALDVQIATSLEAPTAGEGSPSISETLGTDDDGFLVAEGWAELASHIKALPERERTILVLRFFEGWTQSRIAEELGISQMHVSRLLSNTLERLREALVEPEEV